MFKRLFGCDPPSNMILTDQELLRVAILKKRILGRNCVCNLTSIPSRFSKLQKIVDTLNSMFVFDSVVIHIPETYTRFGPYELPAIDGCVINQVKVDYGPGTRIMYAKGDVIVWCDDDTEYTFDSTLRLIEKHIEDDVCTCGSGFNIDSYFSGDYKKVPGTQVQVVEGYGMVVVKREWLDLIMSEFISLNGYTYHDDLILSNLFEKYKIKKVVWPYNIKQYDYGFGKDALHFNEGAGTHVTNNKKILEVFRTLNKMYFSPHISYAISVCDEDRELTDLIRCLRGSIIHSDEIVILVDTVKVTHNVRRVLDGYPWVKVYERAFDGHFANHKNYLNSKCQGKFIFNIDADEIPSSALIENLYTLCASGDLVYVPRVNIIPGATQEFLKRCNFSVSREGFILWPDYQGRIYKNGLEWVGDIHEKIQGATAIRQVNPEPNAALWHIKSVDRMTKQADYYQKRAPK